MGKISLMFNEFLCSGCHTCEVACKQEIKAPEGVKLIAVVEEGPKMVDAVPVFTNDQ